MCRSYGGKMYSIRLKWDFMGVFVLHSVRVLGVLWGVSGVG